jgi:hypothetical protein
MIEILLPGQYLQRAGARAVEPRERLMLAGVDESRERLLGIGRPAGRGAWTGR